MRSPAIWIMLRLRRYRPDRNPLRRRSDRIESAAAAAALIVVLLTVWPAFFLGGLMYDSGLAAERVGPGIRQLVPVSVEAETPESLVNGRMLLNQTAARWTLPGGEIRTGLVPYAVLFGKGTGTRMWVDGSGDPALPPQDHVETVARAVTAGVGVVAAGVALALASFAVGRAVLDRGRYREWDAAWAVADRKWRRPRI